MALAFILSGLQISRAQRVFGENNGQPPVSDTLDGWYVESFWQNSSTSYTMHSSSEETIAVMLTVQYYAPASAMTKTYPAGTVSFTITDIGLVKRWGNPFAAITASNQSDSEWTSVYDSSEHCYVFTNAIDFNQNTPVSGGFEILWELESPFRRPLPITIRTGLSM